MAAPAVDGYRRREMAQRLRRCSGASFSGSIGCVGATTGNGSWHSGCAGEAAQQVKRLHRCDGGSVSGSIGCAGATAAQV